jgi:hypothetical protein
MALKKQGISGLIQLNVVGRVRVWWESQVQNA